MWYDWAIFKYRSPNGKSRRLPGQITAIVQIGAVVEKDGKLPMVRRVDLAPNKSYAVVRLFRKEPKLDFRKSCLGNNAQYTYSIRWGDVRNGFHLLPIETIVATAMVVPNEVADPDCAVDCPSPLGGGYFVLPSREQLGDDFLDVIARESEEIQDSDNSDEEEEENSDKEEEDESDDEDKEDQRKEEEQDEGNDEEEGESDDKEEESSDDKDSHSGDSEEENGDEHSCYKCKRMNYLERYINNLGLD